MKCDDATNVNLCDYDGGGKFKSFKNFVISNFTKFLDCCLPEINALYCDVCKCHEDMSKHPTMESPFANSDVEYWFDEKCEILKKKSNKFHARTKIIEYKKNIILSTK